MKNQIETGRVLVHRNNGEIATIIAIAYVKQVVCIQWMDTKEFQMYSMDEIAPNFFVQL